MYVQKLAHLKSWVQFAGQGEQERRLAGRRRAKQERHPGRPDDAGDALEDVERPPLAELDPDASQQALGHVQRDVGQRGQRAGADVALRLHVEVPEPHLHRGDLDARAVDPRAELLEEPLVVLLGDAEHAVHERLALRQPHRAHVHLLVRVPPPPHPDAGAAAADVGGGGVRRRPHEPRAQALEGRQPLHRRPLQRLLVVHLVGPAAAPRRRAREVGRRVGARHAVQASAQHLHACVGTGSYEPCMHMRAARASVCRLLELISWRARGEWASVYLLLVRSSEPRPLRCVLGILYIWCDAFIRTRACDDGTRLASRAYKKCRRPV